MARVHEIGEPQSQAEAKALAALGEGLPDGYYVVANFELATERGMPYEYDVVVVAPHAVYNVDLRAYHGVIEGNAHQWTFENGGVQPSPIPLANKKSKVLAGELRRQDRRLEEAYVDTLVLLCDDRAKPRFKDEQRHRVLTLSDAIDALCEPRRLPVSTGSIVGLHDRICEVLFRSKPASRVQRIGLYDVVERISQTEQRTVFLAKHRHIRTRPLTILKVFHFDLHAKQDEKDRQIAAIFHDQNAIRLLGVHPNLVDTGDFFAWEADKFVLPTEYVEGGRSLDVALEAQDRRPLTFAEKALVISKVAKGLAHAHAAGVIHRDIRPRNIVVGASLEGRVVKLVNFDLALLREHPEIGDPKGLARRLDARYTAPEVLADPSRATERSDIYSLGIVFFELLTGERPYEEKPLPVDKRRVAQAIRAGGPGLPRSPEDAATVIERMCRAAPAERYASMAEVKEDLAIIGE